MTIRASIVGITGYTGLELFRLLLLHPGVEIAALTARDHEGEALGALYPHLAHLDYRISRTDSAALIEGSDVVFVALPHGAAQDIVAELHGKVKVVDLSADYRLDDPAAYAQYYGNHRHPHLLGEVVYGLPELGSDAIRGARSVANPGCFAALSQLILRPFAGRIAQASVMAVTGSSGSGKTPGAGTHHPVRAHNMKSYGINAHRHIPEILRTAGIEASQLHFVPTSGPFVRGIFATAFVRLSEEWAGDVADFAATYEGCPFVRVCENVELVHVVGSNFCDLSCRADGPGRYIVQGALDNLVKGAAGTAVQNMNLMFGLDEGLGLMTVGAVFP